MSLAAFLFAAAAIVAPLPDPAQEARAKALEQEIRCVVCQNEPIGQSSADMAGDMRALVRERIEAGDSDVQIRAYFEARYGEFVLLRPRWSWTNAPLWAAPLALLLLGAWLARRHIRLRGGEAGPAIDEDR